jgi:hypothetical protein
MGPIFPNQIASYNGTLSSQTGFTSAVSLSCGAGKPSTCVPNPPSAVPATAGTPFTVSAGSTTSGTFNFVVNGVGTDGAHTAHSSQPLTLTVVDFGISTIQDVALTPTGSSPPQQFSVSSFNGFTGIVNLACSGVPTGATCKLAQTSVQLSAGTPSVADSVTLSTSQSPPGKYPITITASTASLPNAPMRTSTFNLNIGDYALSISNPLIQVFPGQGGSFNGTITPLDGYTGTVTITCGPFDPSINCTPPAPITISTASPQDFTVTFTTNANSQTTAPSDYMANISANDANNLTHSEPATVRVLDFNVNGPASITAVQGNPSAPASVSITTLGNWSPTVNLDVSNLPTGAAGFAFLPNASTTSARGSEVVIDSGTAAVGSSNITISGSVAGRQKNIQVPLTISSGSGTTNLGVALTHVQIPIKADPAPVGGTVQFTAHVVNGGAAPASPTLFVTFSEAVTLVSAPGCAPSGNDLNCTLGATFPQDVLITVTMPFSRSVAATAFVSSGSSDTDPTDNSNSDTVQVRPKPFSRNGLPPKLP